MVIKKIHIILAVAAALLTSTTAFAFESKLVDEFWEAQTRHSSKRFVVIKKNREKVPGEINAMLDEALRPETAREERDRLFNVIDRMATAYGRVTGDEEFVNDVRKKTFESRLGPRAGLIPERKVHVIESLPAEGGGALFSPDNITIRQGDTVRWVNKGAKPHLVKSVLSDIGEDGIDSPLLENGQGWKRSLYRPGEYYYMAISGTAMYGKVTVVERIREIEPPQNDGAIQVKAGE